MRIFVTGATGLVGAHTALRLLQAGHALRLLARTPAKARDWFAAQGVDADSLDIVAGDMTDAALMADAMQGCDAVFHAAAMVSVDPRDADTVYRSNLAGLDAVLGTAVRLGIANMVYVSSIAALFRPGLSHIDENTPPGQSQEAYMRSKLDCERRVRDWQDQGAPIQITYPSGVFAPGDPGANESTEALKTFLNSMVPITSSGLQVVDARDLAEVHRLLLENPHAGPATDARYVLGGHFLPWAEVAETLSRITGQRIRTFRAPGKVFRFVGHLLDGVRKLVPVAFPMSVESMAIVTQWSPVDSRRIRATHGIRFRPAEETFRDTIRWQVENGQLHSRFLPVA